MEDIGFSKVVLFYLVSTFFHIGLCKQNNHFIALLLISTLPVVLFVVDQLASWSVRKLSGLPTIVPVHGYHE